MIRREVSRVIPIQCTIKYVPVARELFIKEVLISGHSVRSQPSRLSEETLALVRCFMIRVGVLGTMSDVLRVQQLYPRCLFKRWL